LSIDAKASRSKLWLLQGRAFPPEESDHKGPEASMYSEEQNESEQKKAREVRKGQSGRGL
jgi:hypothetical protein